MRRYIYSRIIKKQDLKKVNTKMLSICKTALSIPVYPGLTNEEQDYVCEKIKEVTQ